MEVQGRSSSYARTKYAADPSPAQRTRMERCADATRHTSSSPRTGAGRPVSAPALSAYAHERGDLGGQSSILVVATRQPDLTDCRAL